MPTESSIFIAKFQDEFTAWNPASTVVPNRAAEATVITIAARMAEYAAEYAAGNTDGNAGRSLREEGNEQ